MGEGRKDTSGGWLSRGKELTSPGFKFFEGVVFGNCKVTNADLLNRISNKLEKITPRGGPVSISFK